MFARFDLSALSRRRSAKFVLAFFLAAVAITLVSFTARAWRDKKGFAAKQDVAAAQPPAMINANSYIRRGLLQSRLHNALSALGDRLEKPGRERLTVVGTLRRQDNSQAAPFHLLFEWPRRMRLAEQSRQGRVIGFDGSNGWNNGAPVNSVDQEMIETLVFDSADNFFLGQIQGVPTRMLGSRFRLDDGTTANYAGPFYDIYQATDYINIGATNRKQSKLFYFNSDTKLLERVNYQVKGESTITDVEIRLGGWRKGDGLTFPGSIERLENNQSVFTLTINSAIAGPRLADGVFNLP
jgi:hypothetical protein